MKILIFGGSGLVGSKFIQLFENNLDIEAPEAKAVNILNKDQISKTVEDFNPDSVINFAAYTNVEEAENQKDDKEGLAYQINVLGAKNVAEVCKASDKHLLHISTEYIFDGEKKDSPYTEEDKPNPINWYGKTKYLGEREVLDTFNKSLVARLSMPYSSFFEAKLDIARFFLSQLKNRQSVKGIEDQQITPTLVNDIAYGLKTLIENKALGIYHISSTDTTTPLDFAKTIAETFHFSYSLISSMKFDEYCKNKKAKLLKNSTLNPFKFEKVFGERILHNIEEGLIILKKEIDERGNI